MGARETALNALIACRREAAWSNGVLKEYIRRDGLDSRDAALATRLCYGVIQNRRKLDFFLGQLLTGNPGKLHPVVRDILHMGLYQLLEMDKIPESAAVNESVSLAKRYCPRQKYAPGLVNAVLRRCVAERETLQQPASPDVLYSHPAELVALLRSYVGEERLEPMLRANNAAPKTVVQVNTCKISTEALTARLQAEGVSAQPHSWMPDCLILEDTGDLERLHSFRDGLFYVQDPAARLSVLCAQLPKTGAMVGDCCAAPGGKSFAAAIAMEGRGTIYASDLYEHRAELIRRGARRLGLEGIQAAQKDASLEDPALAGKLDCVIVDVPCSGYGIIRKKPDIREKNPDSMKDLPALQLQILTAQAGSVRPGGVLIYSTCTLVRRENEGVVEKFRKANPEFVPEPLPLPDIFPKNESGMLTLVPGEYDTDGFFIARLRRKE